ncbi:MAG TPA: flagellin B, partial [Campylobacterales bacterium]|nr:flagellin B [Campylobacterales bacterium]
MGFKINTNIAAMNSHSAALLNNRELDLSLGRLSTGLRINSAADDASGMVIADTLKSQANSLGQAIKNANDAIGIVQIADKAMDEQIKILDTIKTKATQAAADGQSASSRATIQEDIVKLMAELDNIAQTTSFNGLSLLSGGFANKEFQIGAYSHET